MATKNRTALLLYVPNDWLPVIDSARGKMARTEWILEAVRGQLGKRDFPKPAGRGRPKTADKD